MYEEIQFERMVQLCEFNTLFCLETIKDELAEAVKRKKENIAKRQLGMNDVASLLSRVKSIRHSQRNNGLRLNIAPDKEKRLLDMLKQQQQQQAASPDEESSSSASEYADAEDFLYNDNGSETSEKA